jgi:rhamnose utilization protein RhaD (predicted bifunctional aldolase and dehydrogenase)
MSVNNDLFRASISAYCAEIGRDPLLVQGAGGNVSWKANDTLWIKASGTWLADAMVKDMREASKGMPQIGMLRRLEIFLGGSKLTK